MPKILRFSSISALLGATLFSCVAAASKYLWPDGSGETLYGPDGAMFWSDGDGGYIQY